MPGKNLDFCFLCGMFTRLRMARGRFPHVTVDSLLYVGFPAGVQTGRESGVLCG